MYDVITTNIWRRFFSNSLKIWFDERSDILNLRMLKDWVCFVSVESLLSKSTHRQIVHQDQIQSIILISLYIYLCNLAELCVLMTLIKWIYRKQASFFFNHFYADVTSRGMAEQSGWVESWRWNCPILEIIFKLKSRSNVDLKILT